MDIIISSVKRKRVKVQQENKNLMHTFFIWAHEADFFVKRGLSLGLTCLGLTTKCRHKTEMSCHLNTLLLF